MSPRKQIETREIRFAEIEQRFELGSYWFGDRWCPAVFEREHGGYSIRFVKARRISGGSESITYDYFELNADGTVTTAAYGHTKDYKPGRVVDIAEALTKYATPDPTARRVL